MVRGAAYDPKKSFVTFSPQCFEHDISGLLVHLRSDDVLMICKDIDLTDERFVRGVIQECVVPYVVTEIMVMKTVVLRNKPIGALLGWRFSIRTARQDSHRQLKPFNGLCGVKDRTGGAGAIATTDLSRLSVKSSPCRAQDCRNASDVSVRATMLSAASGNSFGPPSVTLLALRHASNSPNEVRAPDKAITV